jgi:hypothetical protein
VALEGGAASDGGSSCWSFTVHELIWAEGAAVQSRATSGHGNDAHQPEVSIYLLAFYNILYSHARSLNMFLICVRSAVDLLFSRSSASGFYLGHL